MSIESIRAQLEALKCLIRGIEADLDYGWEPEMTLTCDHPADARIDLSTMGAKRWECGICGYFYNDGGE